MRQIRAALICAVAAISLLVSPGTAQAGIEDASDGAGFGVRVGFSGDGAPSGGGSTVVALVGLGDVGRGPDRGCSRRVPYGIHGPAEDDTRRPAARPCLTRPHGIRPWSALMCSSPTHGRI